MPHHEVKVTGLTPDQHRAAAEYLTGEQVTLTKTTITFAMSDPVAYVNQALAKTSGRGYPRQPLQAISRKLIGALATAHHTPQE